LFHREVCRFLGTKLADMFGPTVTDLAPRLRQVLTFLLEGDGEKQVAARLGISRHTVHEHVKRLHRHFGVASRSELLSRTNRFLPVLQKLIEDEAAPDVHAAIRAFGDAFRLR
jgi:DNA-binding CsgD family transcriptional regulator